VTSCTSVQVAVAEGDNDPCRNNSRDKTGVDFICNALLENDFRDHIQSLTAYPFELCHGQNDEIVTVRNAATLNLTSSNGKVVYVIGNHILAAPNCMLRFANFFYSDMAKNAVPTSSGVCDAPTTTTAPLTATTNTTPTTALPNTTTTTVLPDTTTTTIPPTTTTTSSLTSAAWNFLGAAKSFLILPTLKLLLSYFYLM